MARKQWGRDDLLGLTRSFQPACVLAAAVDLDVFSFFGGEPMAAAEVARRVGTDLRATTVLLDALVAMELLTKHGSAYGVPAEVADLLTETGSRCVLPIVRHHANCLRRWAQLPWVVKDGKPAERRPSIRGEAADEAAFIGGMHNLCEPVADELVAQIGAPRLRHLLDVGGASGTWTIAWLRAAPEATAMIFDLPDVIAMARERLEQAGMADRVTLVPGDFYSDDLPGGADLAWVSAITHQNSREQNRVLFGKVHRSLAPGGALLLRDLVMDESHTQPAGGAMFAVNMLVATGGGGTYSFAEYREDLQAAGFAEVSRVRQDAWMNSVIRAAKGERAG